MMIPNTQTSRENSGQLPQLEDDLGQEGLNHEQLHFERNIDQQGDNANADIIVMHDQLSDEQHEINLPSDDQQDNNNQSLADEDLDQELGNRNNLINNQQSSEHHTGDEGQIEGQQQPNEPIHQVRSILEVKFPTQQQAQSSIQQNGAPPENLFLVDWNCACCQGEQAQQWLTLLQLVEDYQIPEVSVRMIEEQARKQIKEQETRKQASQLMNFLRFTDVIDFEDNDIADDTICKKFNLVDFWANDQQQFQSEDADMAEAEDDENASECSSCLEGVIRACCTTMSCCGATVYNNSNAAETGEPTLVAVDTEVQEAINAVQKNHPKHLSLHQRCEEEIKNSDTIATQQQQQLLKDSTQIKSASQNWILLSLNNESKYELVSEVNGRSSNRCCSKKRDIKQNSVAGSMIQLKRRLRPSLNNQHRNKNSEASTTASSLIQAKRCLKKLDKAEKKMRAATTIISHRDEIDSEKDDENFISQQQQHHSNQLNISSCVQAPLSEQSATIVGTELIINKDIDKSHQKDHQKGARLQNSNNNNHHNLSKTQKAQAAVPTSQAMIHCCQQLLKEPRNNGETDSAGQTQSQLHSQSGESTSGCLQKRKFLI